MPLPRSLAFLLLFACTPAKEPVVTDPVIDEPAAVNEPPSAPTVSITPEHPEVGDALAVTIVTPSVDPEGDLLTYRYAWSHDGTPDADLTTEAVPTGRTQDTEIWQVTVTPNDGTADGPPGVASIRIGNLPPTAPTMHIEPVVPYADDDLTLIFDVPASDPDGDAVSQTIVWYLDDVRIATWDGATTVGGVLLDAGEVARAVVSVSDGRNAPVVTEATVTIGNHPPVFTSVELTPVEATDGANLTAAVTATDADDDAIVYSYTWYRDEVPAGDVGDSDVVNANATTAGETWRYAVTASDGTTVVSADGPSVTLTDADFFRYGSYVDAILAGDDSDGVWDSITGTWSVVFQTEGGAYGDVDCIASYAIRNSEPSTRCGDCTYSFTFELVYDPAASAMGTPAACAFLARDGTGKAFDSARVDIAAFYIYGPTPGHYVDGVATPLPSWYYYWYVYGDLYYTRPGLIWAYGTTVTEATDSATLDAWYYYYRRY